MRNGFFHLSMALLVGFFGGAPSGLATDSQESVFLSALHKIESTPSGQLLLEDAKKHWGLSQTTDLLKYIRANSVSRTDAVLTRTYDPETGKETRQRSVIVLLKTKQSLENVSLDLAHELTHAISPPTWDPYDPSLTAGKYIHAALEARGGEIDAVTMECQVALELAKLENRPIIARCKNYHQSSEIRRSLIRRDFYRVGKTKSALQKRLGSEAELFPLLSSDAPELYSATGSAPYPIALFREYQELQQVACENAMRRIKIHSGRAPASDALMAEHCRKTSSKSSAIH